MQTRLRDNLEEQHYGHGTEVPQGSMELLYIWINEDETGFIQQQGFNFSPNYHFEMKVIETNDDGKPMYGLFCTENPDYPNVWKTGNVVNLTAVVGENGSGKTALLGYLENILLLPILPENRPEYVGSTNEKNKKYKTLLIYSFSGTIHIFHNFSSGEFNNGTDYKEVNINEQDYNEVATMLNRQTRVYMTNGLAYSCSVQESNKYVSRMVFSSEKNKAMAQIFYGKKNMIRTDVLPSKKFFSMQKLIASCKLATDFEQLVVINYYNNLLSNDSLRASSLLPRNRRIFVNIREPFVEIRKLYRGIGEKDFHSDDQFIQKISEAMIVHGQWVVFLKANNHLNPVSRVLLLLIFELQLLTDSDFFVYEKTNDDSRQSILHALSTRAYSLIHQYECDADCDEAILQYYLDAIEEVNELHEILNRCSQVLNYVPLEDLAYKTDRVIQQVDDAEAYCLFCGYICRMMRKNMSFVLKYIDIRFTPLSSGEQALQNILSWLSLVPSYENILSCSAVPIHDNILLLLDEVDLYMHPEWQRKFLKCLSDELALEYPNKHIQIIISTHSPLVLSDIPSSNIIYLEKNDEKCTIAQRSEQNESFGANIYSLLKDSFFLKRSIGEFAYSRISEMIKELEKMKECSDDQDQRAKCVEYRRLINIIGEPVLRKKLLMMCDDILGKKEPNPDELALERIEQLLKRDAVKYRERLMKMLSDVKPD